MDDEALLEDAIAKELLEISDENLSEEHDDNLEDEDVSGIVSVEEFSQDLSDESYDIIGSMKDYISKIQGQSALLETELAECDELLHEAEIARKAPDPELVRLAEEQGITVEELRQQVLLAIDEEERLEQTQEVNEVAMDTVTDLLTSAAQLSARTSDDPTGDADMGAFLTSLQGPVAQTTCDVIEEKQSENIPNSDDVTTTTVALKEDDKTEGQEEGGNSESVTESSQGVVAVVYEHEVLERQLREELRVLDQKHKHMSSQHQKELKEFQAVEAERSERHEAARRQQHDVIKQEVAAEQVRQAEVVAKLQQEEKEKQSQLALSLDQYEAEINELAKQAEREKAEFEIAMAEETKKREEKRHQAAVKIQARYRGYRARQEHGEDVSEAVEKAKEKTYAAQLNKAQHQIDERIEKERTEKEEKEQIAKDKEEKERREEELRQQKLEEERLRKEEEKRRKEEEKRQKEEEKRRKEEEKKRKAEEERLRKEEEKRKKEEEKKRKEEEKKRKAEEEKQRKEEERQRKEEEKRKKEEEEKRKREEEERIKKEEAERVLKEEQLKKEREENEMKEKEEQMKLQENDEPIPANQEQKVSLSPRKLSKDSALNTTMDIKGEKLAVEQRGLTEFIIDQVAKTNDTEPKKQPHTPPSLAPVPNTSSPGSKTPRPPSAPKPDATFERPISGKRRSSNQIADLNHVNGDVVVTMDNTRKSKLDQTELAATRDWGEFLPRPIEEARLHWMGKQCKSLSKIVSENKTLRTTASKKPVRRPASASALPLLDETRVLTAARVNALKMVTTVELSDLPGCSLKTLCQCAHLQSLAMPRCNLVTTDGLENCKQLKALYLQNNKLELLTTKELTSLIYADFSHNALCSIHGLDGCTNLRFLSLAHNKITRLGGLASLKHLHSLNVSHNQLITSRELQEAPSVQCLDVSSNHLQALEGLENLALLQILRAQSNSLMQAPKLTNNVLLHTCDLSDNSISFLSSLTQTWLPLLTNLNLSQNSISVLDPMLNFLLLENLDLSQNQLTDVKQLVTPLRATRYLLSLDLSENPVIHETDCSAKLQEVLPFLEKLNKSSVPNSGVSLSRTQFESMCMEQALQVQQLDRAYQTAIGRTTCALSRVRAHEKYYNTSHVLASDMRYSHEYGITMVTPKPIDIDFSDAAIGNKTQTGDVTINGVNNVAKTGANNAMKNRFEDALKGDSLKIASINQVNDSKSAFDNMLSSKNQTKISSNTAHLAANVNFDIVRQSPTPLDPKASFEANVMKSMTNTNARANHTPVPPPQPTQDMKSRFDAAILNKGAPPKQNGVHLSGDHTNGDVTANKSRSFTTNVTATKVMELLGKSGGDYAQVLDYSATKIQATWRGYILRKRLNMALNYVKFDDLNDDLENFDEEVNLGDFDFNMDDLDADLVVPDTPQMPVHHAVLGKPPSHPSGNGVKPSYPANQYSHSNQIPNNQYSHAGNHDDDTWRANSALSDPSPRGKPPLPPLSRLSDAHTYDSKATARSKKEKEEKLAEEWGFKNNKTAELMFQRARKLKYNATKKKKMGKLDPVQRLELYRRLEEASRVKVTGINKHTVPRKEYFQAREDEARIAALQHEQLQRDNHTSQHAQVSRTFEWVHTQAGAQQDLTSARKPHGKADLAHGSSESNLPRMDPAVLAGGRAMFVNSPSLDVQSIESASTIADPATKPQRLWRTNHNRDDKLPPIKNNSASSNKSKERMSFRNPKTDVDIGWGGGKKRTKNRP